MNRLVAYTLLGFGLVSGVVACGDDDDGGPVDNGGTSSGGTASAGKGGGGSSAGGTSASGAGGAAGGKGGTAGTSSGGTPVGGSAGSGLGGEAVGGEDGVGGEAVGGEAGAGGEGGAGGAPSEEPQLATPYWLSTFCDAVSKEELACEKSEPWMNCFLPYAPFLSQGTADGTCENDDEEFTKLIATFTAFDNLAAACPNPTVEDFSCSFSGAPKANDQACGEAYTAAVNAYTVCKTMAP